MNENKVSIIGIVFLALCLALAYGIYYLDRDTKALKAQYDELEQRRANLSQDKSSLEAQIRVFKDAFSQLEAYNVRATSNDVDFYTQIQGKIDPYAGNQSILIKSTNQHGVANGRSSISLILEGDYYTFMKILADWRNMTTTVRVSQLAVTALNDSQLDGEINANVTLEAIVSAR